MEEKKKKKKIIILTICTIVIVALVAGITYAYFKVKGQSEDIVVTSKNLKIVFEDGDLINTTNLTPLVEDEYLTKGMKKTFKLAKDNSNSIAIARMDLTDLSLSSEFKTNPYDIKWALYEENNKITTGTFAPTKDGSTSINIANNIEMSDTTKTYNLYIWINESTLDQSSLIGGNLTGKITITGENNKSNTLASNILKETVKNNPTIVTFNEVIEENTQQNFTSSANRTVATSYSLNQTTGNFDLSGTITENTSYNSSHINYYTCNTTSKSCATLYKIKTVSDTTVTYADKYTRTYTSSDKGLYVQKDDNEKSEYGFPTYYYRGTVENNYVQLGTYKSDISNKVYEGSTSTDTVVAHTNDPILWRIVRINEDGSIRLIAEHSTGLPPQKYNSPSSSKYILDDGTASSAKSVIDTWYSSNITESDIDSKIQTSGFCNDITGETTLNSRTRLYTNFSPIFKCTNGSIIANEKAGMITADELMYSGALMTKKIENNVTYMYNKTRFWTITPNTKTTQMYWNSLNLYFTSITSTNTTTVSRAVINLKADTIISSGDGTQTTPYIIQ